MSKIAIHLSFNGDCAEAFDHYARVLGGTIRLTLPYGQSPMAGTIAEADRDRLMHASLDIAGFHLMGADAITGHPYRGSEGYAVSLSYPTVEQAEQVFHALNEGGTTIMPMGPTFWAKAFGVTKDRFGVSWMVGCEQAPEP